MSYGYAYVCQYTLKEQLSAKRMCRESKTSQEMDPIFYTIVKQNPNTDLVVALQFIFSEGKITCGRIHRLLHDLP